MSDHERDSSNTDIDLFSKEETDQFDSWPDYRPDPYPSNGCCQACGRSEREFPSFGTTETRSTFETRPLAMTVREVELDIFAASWECPICISRQGTLWELRMENSSGKQLSNKERNAIAEQMEKDILEWPETLPVCEAD